MPYETSPQLMSVEDLAEKCAQETEHYRWNQTTDTQYCFELFRRAIVNHDQAAWDRIVAQYRWQVERWVRRYPEFLPSREEEQDFVFEAFGRFWKYFTPDKLNKSKNLAAVLSYLHTCVNGSVLDFRRKMQQRQLEQGEGDEERDYPDHDQVPEDIHQKEEFWQLVKKRLKDEKEYTIVYASFSLTISPREILDEYPGVFHDIDEIYQCKSNLLARLSRDPELKKFLGLND